VIGVFALMFFLDNYGRQKDNVYLTRPYMASLLLCQYGDKKVSDGNKRERTTIQLTKRYLDLLNLLIEKRVYNSHNEAIEIPCESCKSTMG